MNRETIHTLLCAGLILGTTTTRLAAIEFGQLDGDQHPAVCLLVFDIADAEGNVGPAWRCSGTLIAPDVVLTAGHCTDGAVGARAYFLSDVEPIARPQMDPPEYPYPGPNSIEASELQTHPDFIWAFPNTSDVGIVRLERPVAPEVVPPDQYGKLPESAGILDPLARRRGLNRTFFTVVGYGLQSMVPHQVGARTRYAGEVMLVNLTNAWLGGYNILFSSNPGLGTGLGGTCFGDSGGPVFFGDSLTIIGVTSFATNPNCVGTDGAYRVDLEDKLMWIHSFLNGH